MWLGVLRTTSGKPGRFPGNSGFIRFHPTNSNLAIPLIGGWSGGRVPGNEPRMLSASRVRWKEWRITSSTPCASRPVAFRIGSAMLQAQLVALKNLRISCAWSSRQSDSERPACRPATVFPDDLHVVGDGFAVEAQREAEQEELQRWESGILPQFLENAPKTR